MGGRWLAIRKSLLEEECKEQEQERRDRKGEGLAYI